MTDDNGRCPGVPQVKPTASGSKDEDHGIFDPKSPRLVEPVFQMTEADWSKYGNSTNERKEKEVCRGTFYGFGFPSVPTTSNSPQSSASPAENGNVPQRYREASDSEWDAYERRKEEAIVTSEREGKSHIAPHNALHRRFSHDKVLNNHRAPGKPAAFVQRPQSVPHVQQTRAPVPERELYPVASTSLRSTQPIPRNPAAQNRNFHSQRTRGQGFSRHDNKESNDLVDSVVDRDRVQPTKPLAKKGVVADERTVGRPSRHRRQNVSKTDFELICNALFSSDEDTNDGVGDGPGTSASCAHLPDVEEDYVQVRPTSITSLSIDQFVNDNRKEILFDRIPRYGDKDFLDASLYQNIQKFLSENPMSSGALSVTVDLLEYPPKLVPRPRNRLLRPVIIDGSAVAGCFDKEYSVHWGRSLDPAKLLWASNKVLPMKPICLTVAMFLLRGHKVTVLLPTYYRDAYISGMRNKVDDLEALKVLTNLQIVQFAELKGVDSVMDAIRREVDKVDALLISSGSFDVREDWPRRPTFPPPADQQQQQMLPSAFTKASKRMLTPTFYGRNRDMTMSFGFHTKEDGTWRIVEEEHMCYYEPHMDLDSNIDDEGRICQQLLFEDQLVSLKDLFEWPALYRRAIAAVLRLEHLATSAS
ncbi:hypothetical protein Y032_0096g2875 [Ancylostoma ceylanicum]|uniref:Zc3h12a-like Ribonuclease NYN domain-containing protein n=1 Tax=Ancylostoma ceylanicum TaxID=53326 RepID=A0A016TJ32_9BILA|nr:hypothetical protein Y032_0096g2875 [Ancylostoma ceylanicum]